LNYWEIIMAIELEPTEWASKCGRFEIIKWSVTKYRAYDNKKPDVASDRLPTFAAAVAWCEERAKQQQGGQSNV